MGLIKNTSDIVYNLTKAQELRQKKENDKRLEQELKNDVKRLLNYYLDYYYNIKNKSILEIYQEKNNICREVLSDIEKIEEKLTIDERLENLSNGVKKEKDFKYKDKFDSYNLTEFIKENYIKEYNKFKKEIETIKLNDILIIKEKIRNDNEIIYNRMRNKGIPKNIIFSSLQNEENVKLYYKDFKDKEQEIIKQAYKEACKELVKEHKNDIEITQKRKSNISLGWKMYGILSILEKITRKH